MPKVHNCYVYIMANTKNSPTYIGMTRRFAKKNNGTSDKGRSEQLYGEE